MWVVGRAEQMRAMGRAMVVVEMAMVAVMEMAVMEMVAVVEMVAVQAAVMEMKGVERAATGVALTLGLVTGKRRVAVRGKRRVAATGRQKGRRRVAVRVRRRLAVRARRRVVVTEEEGPELVERAKERVSPKISDGRRAGEARRDLHRG